MKTVRFLQRGAMWIIAWLLLAGAAWPVQAAKDDPSVLVLGRISDDPKRHYEQLKALLDYVLPRMQGTGIRQGRILMARDAQQMASYLRRGRVDWISETAGTSMLLKDRAGAVPLLLTERDGQPRYTTVFFTRRDSPVRTFADLSGHTIAFQNTASTSAYLVPAMVLLEQGVRLEILLSPADRPSRDSLGYVFARSEQNIATWVHKRLVDVGTMSDVDWNNPQAMPRAYRKDMRLLHRTAAFPRALEMVRSDLDPAVRERLREVLVQAAADPQAAPTLKRYFRTTRFLPIDEPTAASLETLRQGVVRVRTEVE